MLYAAATVSGLLLVNSIAQQIIRTLAAQRMKMDVAIVSRDQVMTRGLRREGGALQQQDNRRDRNADDSNDDDGDVNDEDDKDRSDPKDDHGDEEDGESGQFFASDGNDSFVTNNRDDVDKEVHRQRGSGAAMPTRRGRS